MSVRVLVHHRRIRRAFTRRPFCTFPLEPLETRTLFSTFTVSTLSDSGAGSLRAAIAAANATPGADAIKFAPSLKGTIPLASQLTVSDDLSISGPGNKVTVSGN